MKKMKVLITGNPRSGTLSVKNMLRSAGLDVQHERCGKDGTVSCFFFKRVPYYPREKLTAKRHLRESFDVRNFEQIYHLVRNPLKCIPSMAKVVGVGHREWLHDIDIVDKDIKPKLRWAATAWYLTNRYIEDHLPLDDIIRIEELKDCWPEELCAWPGELHQHRSSGTRKSKPLTLNQLEQIAAGDLFDGILEMAEGYGYEL